jgi:hypothetical protein
MITGNKALQNITFRVLIILGVILWGCESVCDTNGGTYVEVNGNCV